MGCRGRVCRALSWPLEMPDLPAGSEWRMEANGTHPGVSREQRLWRDQVWESRQGSSH